MPRAKVEKPEEELELEAPAEEAVEAPAAPKSDRQARFDAHVANYMKANPVKGAAKKARGEFDKIPDSFK